MVQKLRNTTGAFARSALVCVGWVFFVLAQVCPESALNFLFASIARVLPNALARMTARASVMTPLHFYSRLLVCHESESPMLECGSRGMISPFVA